MKKILVANRGEIAARVLKTARKMGIQTVAVYSEPDANALHVELADEAYLLGPGPSNESYLLIDKIIDIAKQSGADGIHPGYGFLSENAEFAKQVEANNITFIGPGIDAINTMGSKIASKKAVSAYNIPLVPGTDNAVHDDTKALEIAKEIGFPVLIKASAGGGGKGMKKAQSESNFSEFFKSAKSEAKSAFGNDDVFIEKYIESPRHIEFQILCDKHGNAVHLFERECSIQRRHQKVIEETPSLKLDNALRNKMGEDAIKVAQSCSYIGAGTVEFIMDADNNYYFLEMNTRLQVEHPITEMITGIDLVEQQIKVARGEKLSFSQEEIIANGHAIELRVYAEDPKNNFLPSIGTLIHYELPEGENIRVDNGFREGDEIPIYYDPMIAKLVTWGETRTASIQLMQKAINQYKIGGIQSTLEFGHFVLKHPAFLDGSYDTHFVPTFWDGETSDLTREDKVASLFTKLLYKDNLKKLKLRSE